MLVTTVARIESIYAAESERLSDHDLRVYGRQECKIALKMDQGISKIQDPVTYQLARQSTSSSSAVIPLGVIDDEDPVFGGKGRR